MVDAAIARLRGPPQQMASRGPRMPSTPVYGQLLVNPEEFYAHAKIDSRPAQILRPIKATFPTPAATTESMLPIRNKQQSDPISISHGQGGQAGSRWADPPAIGPSASTPARSQMVADMISTSTLSSVDSVLVANKAPQVILRSFDGVKISNGSLPDAFGVVRLVTNLGSVFVNLQALIKHATVLDEALYASDTFADDNGTITFQAYSKNGETPTWKLTFPLPYQSTVLINVANGRMRTLLRPVRKQPRASDQNTSPTKELSNVEVPARQVSTVEAPAYPQVEDESIATQIADSPNIPAAEEEQLLIDFNAEDEPDSISPSIQILMGLMTDERSVADFLGRLDEPHTGYFLDQVFSVAGHPPPEGYSPQMLSVAKGLVLKLYTQSEIFHRLPAKVSESLADETGQKVLEKALSIWRAQHVEVPQSSEADDGTAVKRIRRPTIVYSSDELLGLRRRASTIEQKLIPEYDPLSTKKKSIASASAVSLSGESHGSTSGRNTPLQRPTAPDYSSKAPRLAVESITLPAVIATAPAPFIQISAISLESINIPPTQGAAIPARTDAAVVSQNEDMFNAMQPGHKFQHQDSLSSDHSLENQNSVLPLASHNAGNMESTNPFWRQAPVAVPKREEPQALLMDQDIKSESSDSELSTKLRAMSLANNLVEPTLVSAPVLGSKKENGSASALAIKMKNAGPSALPIQTESCKGSALIIKTENAGPSALPTKTENVGISALPIKRGSGNASALLIKKENVRPSAPAAFAAVPPSASILEINNGDLKGNPGLAASRWAQSSNEPSTVSGLRRIISTRAPRTPIMSIVAPHQPEALPAHQPLGSNTHLPTVPYAQQSEVIPSHQASVPNTHLPTEPYAQQPPYAFTFAPPTFMPHQTFMAPQPVIPQLTTVLVTNPITGKITEVTGVQKAAPPAMPFFPLHQGHLAPHVPVTFQMPSAITSPTKSQGSSLICAAAQSLSPDGGIRSPLSPIGRQNAQAQGKGHTGSSPRPGH